MLKDNLRQIDTVVSKINTHPEYSAEVYKEKSHALRAEAEKHSLEIELANEKRILTNKERKLFLGRLDSAADFLSREGIDNYTLSKLGYLIEPDQNPAQGFRNEHLKFGGFNAVDPERVQYRIQHLVDILQNPDIHPYMDGNGRAARMLQNFCLQQRNYPVAIIDSEEVKDYLNVLHKALEKRYNGETSVFTPCENEIRFHEFISQRVLSSAISLEKELEKRKAYEIKLTNLDQPGIAFSISKIFKCLGRKTNKNISVSIDKRKGERKSETLSVKGDIGRDDLKKILMGCSKKYRIGFAISDGTNKP